MRRPALFFASSALTHGAYCRVSARRAVAGALRASLAANMRYIEQALNGAFPTLNWQAPPSTYLAWIDLRPLGIDDQKLQHTLIHQEKIAIMPGDTYGAEGRGFVRLNAGCPRLKLEKGVNGLINAIRTVR